MPLTAPARLFLRCLAWLEQIDDWRDTRPILERLGQVRWLNRRLFRELGDALCDGEESVRATCSVVSSSCRIAAANRRWPAASSASVGRGRLRASLAPAMS